MIPISNAMSHHSYALDMTAQRTQNTAHGASVQTVEPEKLLNQEFGLKHVIIDGQAVEFADRRITPSIKFKNSLVPEHKLFLDARVDNHFSSPLSYENGILKSSMFISTFMATHDTLEHTIQNAFREGVTVSLQEGTLILRSSTTELVYKQS